MRSSGDRSTLVLGMPQGVAALLVVALIVVVAFFAGSPPTPAPGRGPIATQLVAGRTDAPDGGDSQAPGPEDSFGAEPDVTPEPSEGPGESTAPDPGSAIVPGAVDHSSLAISATYRVNAAITVGTGAMDVTTRIDARNDSGAGIDRLELNTLAARLGNIRITAATVDDVAVKVAIDDQTLTVPLGGVLPAGATATVRIAYRATLRRSVTDFDWMFSRSGGTLALYRWIPWISRSIPFDRPNSGDPFETPSSPQVDVEILTDLPMVLAAPAGHVDMFSAGRGSAWSFSAHDVRDVAVVLAPDFRVARGESNGIPIRAYTRPGGLSGPQLISMAADAISSSARLLDVEYPWSVLTIVETQGGVNIESPGQVWVPEQLDTRNREFAVYHGTAQQWFSGLVGSDQRAEPFADEAPADLLARTALGTLRASRCPRAALDRSIAAYSGTCYYEVVFVQGGALLNEIRLKVGTNRFWGAMGAYLEANRDGIGGTRKLLEALRAASDVNLLPLLRQRFPDLY